MSNGFSARSRSAPFPPRYRRLLIDDGPLSRALVRAFGDEQRASPAAGLAPIAISLVVIDERTTPPRFLHGGIRSGFPPTGRVETYYSASLLKVAAMYAAFELRKSCVEFARDSLLAPAAALFRGLRQRFDPRIGRAVRALQIPLLPPELRLPKYEQIFAAIPDTTGGMSFQFTARFMANMRRMIVDSDNSAASACITDLGYSWINGALRHGGFFSSPPPAGIWLAGLFGRKFPRVEIPSANDGLVAHAMTCADMANLYAHIWQGSLVDAQSSADMLVLLADAEADETCPRSVRGAAGASTDLSFRSPARSGWDR